MTHVSSYDRSASCNNRTIQRALPLAIVGALIIGAALFFLLAPSKPAPTKKPNFVPQGLSLLPTGNLQQAYDAFTLRVGDSSWQGKQADAGVYAWQMPETPITSRAQLMMLIEQKLMALSDPSGQVMTLTKHRQLLASQRGATCGVELLPGWQAAKGGKPGYWYAKNVRGRAKAAGLREGDQIVQVDAMPVEKIGNPTGEGNIRAVFDKGDVESICVISVLRGQVVVDIPVPRVITGYAAPTMQASITAYGGGVDISYYCIGTVGIANMRTPGVAEAVANDISMLNTQMCYHGSNHGGGNSNGGNSNDAEPNPANENMKILVLDLGGAQGGSSLEAAKVAALFLPSGHVLTTVRRSEGKDVKVSYNIVDGKLIESTTVGDGKATDVEIKTPVYVFKKKLYVLVDSDTSGAAEQVARVLKANGVEIIGFQSAGKNTISETFEIGERLVVRLTTGRYTTADGTPITGCVSVDFVLPPGLSPEAKVEMLIAKLVRDNPTDPPNPDDIDD